KLLGVSGVFDYAGLNRNSRLRSCSCCLPHILKTAASGLHLFGAGYPPRLAPVYASLSTSRYPAQDSGPSRSLVLTRKALSSSTSCRFIPAHQYLEAHPLEKRNDDKGGDWLTVNLGTGLGHSVLEIIQAAENATGRPVRRTMGRRRPGDPPILVADPAKAQSVLGWTAQRNLAEIVSSAWRWMRKNSQRHAA